MRKILLIIPLLLSLVSVVRADIVFGNIASYTNSNGTPTVVAGSATPGSTLWKGIGFTMGSSSYTLTSVNLRLNNVGGAAGVPATTDSPTVSIYIANGSNRPGTLVGTLNNPTFSSPTPSAVYTFTPASSLTLNAGTKYVLVVQQLTTDGSADTQFDWMNGSPTVNPTGVAASLTGAAFFDYGTNPTIASGSGATTTNYNWFQVNGTLTAVPEPSTYVALMGATALVVAVAVRRRRSV